MADAKSSREAMPWENDPIVQPAGQSAPWEDDPIVAPAEQKKALSSADIDPNLEAPAIVRAQVGALDKPEDRLTAIRKTYPDAQPYDGDNFIMTGPATGKTMIYNQPGWLPSGGDVASILPEAGEGVGAVAGAVTGGVTGGTIGSAVPVVGTTAGAVSGGIVGAGTGATLGRETVQRGLNWMFGNEDTRTGSEQAWDAVKTFGMNAAGEGLGLALAPVAGKVVRSVASTVKDGPKGMVLGQVDDPVKAAQRVADAKDAGIDLTAGMITGSKQTALKEQALAATSVGKPIEDRIAGAFDGLERRGNEIVGNITPQTVSKQQLGQALIDQAEALKGQIKDRGDYLYSQVGEKTGDAPALGSNTRSYLEQLQTERKAMGKSAALNNGSAVDQVIKQAKAITDDIGTGVNFNTLKEARTNIRLLKDDPNIDPVLRSRYQGLYSAMTEDMEQTAKASGDDALQAWRKANNYSLRNSKGSWSPKGAVAELANKSPEQAADWVLLEAKKGGTRLNAVRRQIERTEGGADVWNSLTGSTVERMMYEGGTFNPTRFWKEWNAVAPEAKDALFKGTSRTTHRDDLDALARMAENFKNYRRMDNHSNTTKAAGVLGEMNPFDRTTLLGALFVGPKAFIASSAAKAGNLAYKSWQAKLLANPDTTRWFRGIPAAQMQKGGLRAHVAKLAQIGASTTDNALATAIDSYLREVGYSD